MPNHIFELSGGIGNQLFQYHAGNLLCESPVFDMSMIRPPFMKHGHDLRDLGLEVQNCDRFTQNGEIFWRAENALLTILHKISGLEKISKSVRVLETGYSRETPDLISQAATPLRIRGYFQSFRYLGFEPQGSGCERLPLELATEFSLDWLSDSTPWTSIHVRLGDYLSLKSSVGVLSTDYYERAMKIVKKRNPTGRYLVFSDEPAHAYKLLKFGREEKVSFVPSNLPANESMILMSHAQNMILGNSTFSYWAAATNPNAKLVLVPEPWHANLPTPNELCPPNWLRVDSGF